MKLYNYRAKISMVKLGTALDNTYATMERLAEVHGMPLKTFKLYLSNYIDYDGLMALASCFGGNVNPFDLVGWYRMHTAKDVTLLEDTVDKETARRICRNCNLNGKPSYYLNKEYYVEHLKRRGLNFSKIGNIEGTTNQNVSARFRVAIPYSRVVSMANYISRKPIEIVHVIPTGVNRLITQPRGVRDIKVG